MLDPQSNYIAFANKSAYPEVGAFFVPKNQCIDLFDRFNYIVNDVFWRETRNTPKILLEPNMNLFKYLRLLRHMSRHTLSSSYLVSEHASLMRMRLCSAGVCFDALI